MSSLSLSLTILTIILFFIQSTAHAADMSVTSPVVCTCSYPLCTMHLVPSHISLVSVFLVLILVEVVRVVGGGGYIMGTIWVHLTVPSVQ